MRLIAINCGWFIAPASFFVADSGSERRRAPVAAFGHDPEQPQLTADSSILAA